MYKKITHTIVEEHFDHPMGVGIAANVSKPKFARSSLAEIMPSGQFKSFVDNYFMEMEDKMVEFANATFDVSLDFQSAIANVMEFETLGNMLGKYYDAEFQERFNQQFGNSIMQLLYYWRNLIRNADTSETLAVLERNAYFLAFFMNQYNNAWDRDIVKSLLNDFLGEFVNLGKAKFTKNTTNENATLDRIAAAGSKLSNYVSNGVIQQFSELFTA